MAESESFYNKSRQKEKVNHFYNEEPRVIASVILHEKITPEKKKKIMVMLKKYWPELFAEGHKHPKLQRRYLSRYGPRLRPGLHQDKEAVPCVTGWGQKGES